MEFFGYFASLLMGITLGLMGGGGSILTVPILVYLFGIAPIAATGYSLFIVGLTALIGSALAIRRREVSFTTALAFVIPSLLGVHFSRAWLLPRLPDVLFSFGDIVFTKEILIMGVFAGFMVLASLSMLGPRPSGGNPKALTAMHWLLIATLGLCIGMIAGFVGAGGGFLILPALIMVVGLSMRIAIGTSLLIIAFQSLLGFSGDLVRGADVDWSLLLMIATMAGLGIIIGSVIARKMNENTLKTAFGWFVLAMGSSILIDQVIRLLAK